MKSLLVIFIATFALMPVLAKADTVNLSGDVSLSTGTYTLSGTIDNIITNSATTFTFTLPADASYSLNVVSASKHTFSNTETVGWTVAFTCDTNESRLAFSNPTVAKTVTVTPSATACASGSGNTGSGSGTGSSGGGGGGGGGGYSAPVVETVAPDTAQSLALLKSQIDEAKQKLAGKLSGNFDQDLEPGQTNDDVTRLQTLLASDKSIYPEGTISGFYGPLTVQAVKRFQAKTGLSQAGRVGPLTRQKLAEVFGGAMVFGEVKAIVSSAAFDANFGINSVGEFVRNLQKLLNSDPETRVADSGPGSNGQETDRFGSLTKSAVERFQRKYQIASPGSSGYGNVGPLTRAKLNALSGGSMTAPAPAPTPSTPTVTPAPAAPADNQALIDSIQAQIKSLQDAIKNINP